MKRNNWLLVTLLIVAFLLRLPGADSEFWYDEAFSTLLVKLPYEQMIQATAGDTHPPGWYSFMWLWAIVFGDSEFLFRLPSILFGIASIFVMWRITIQLELAPAPTVALLALMVFSPFQIYFSTEARMYTALQLAVLIAALAIFQKNWLLLTTANAALVWMHNYGLFYLAALGLLALWNWRLDIRRWPLWIGIGIAFSFGIPIVSWLPWAVALANQMAIVKSGYWIEPATAGQLIYSLNIYLFGPFTRQFALAGALAAVGWLAWALQRLVVMRPAWLIDVSILAFAPMAMALIVSAVWRPIFLFRGLIGITPWLYLLISLPLSILINWKRLYAACVLIPLFVAGLTGYWMDIRSFKSTTLEAIQLIESGWRPGDIIYSTNDGNWVMWQTYMPPEYRQYLYLLPECVDHDRGALSPATRQALGVKIANLDDIPHQRAWLLVSIAAPTSKCNVDQINAITAGLDPVYVAMNSDISFAGIYLRYGQALASPSQ